MHMQYILPSCMQKVPSLSSYEQIKDKPGTPIVQTAHAHLALWVAQFHEEVSASFWCSLTCRWPTLPFICSWFWMSHELAPAGGSAFVSPYLLREAHGASAISPQEYMKNGIYHNFSQVEWFPVCRHRWCWSCRYATFLEVTWEVLKSKQKSPGRCRDYPEHLSQEPFVSQAARFISHRILGTSLTLKLCARLIIRPDVVVERGVFTNESTPFW
jgi:hypothetical protein